MNYSKLFLPSIGLMLVVCSCQKEISSKILVDSVELTQEKLASLSSILQFPGVGRQNAITFSFDSKAYVGLGNIDLDTALIDLWEFDGPTAAWTRKADFPGNKRLAATGFTIGNKGYVVGGLHDNKGFWEYDPATNQWTRKCDFPVNDLYYAASFTINGKAYVGTGVKDGKLVNDFWEYDPLTDKWTKKADFAGKPMDVAAGFSIAGKGYFAGGNYSLGASKDLWQYDPGSNTWTQKADFPYTGYTTVVFNMHDKAYVGGPGFGSKLWEYDTTNNWSVKIDSIGRHGVGAKAFVIGNKAYIGLGTTRYGYYPTDIWEYEIY